MSRCFPFPPPGYEKKARTDDVDLLKKEKQKEKPHKEEKKDKEKRGNKEKKDKDRSDGKHKDKKDKKEKHKDRKKEKDRDKEKDRSNNLEEKKFLSGQNGEKTFEEKKLLGKSEGHSGEKFVQKEKGRDKDQGSFSGDKKLAGKLSGYNGKKISQKGHLAEDFRDSKFVQQLGRRVRDEGARDGSQLVDKFMGIDRKRDEGLVAKTAKTLVEEKEKNKRIVDRKSDVQETKEETRSAGNAMVQNLAGTVKDRVDWTPRQVENNSERRWEGKEKTKEKGSADKIQDKHRDKDGDRKSHGKDEDRDKEKKEEKAKAKGENRNLEQDNLKRSNKDGPVGTINPKSSHASKEGNNCAVAEENLRKRKDLEKNGFLHVNDIKLNKFPRTTSSSRLSTDNGRTSESCQAAIPLTSDIPGAGTSLKAENKERKVNGTIEAQLLSVSPTKHLSARARASQINDVSMKPHPDSKYLSLVLSVPNMEEWSDFDDQEWLFHCSESQSKKPKVGFSEIDQAPQVWAEALQIESTDVCALPYVVPY